MSEDVLTGLTCWISQFDLAMSFTFVNMFMIGFFDIVNDFADDVLFGNWFVCPCG